MPFLPHGRNSFSVIIHAFHIYLNIGKLCIACLLMIKILHEITFYFFCIIVSFFSLFSLIFQESYGMCQEYISSWLVFPQASLLSCDCVREGKGLHDSKGMLLWVSAISDNCVSLMQQISQGNRNRTFWGPSVDASRTYEYCSAQVRHGYTWHKISGCPGAQGLTWTGRCDHQCDLKVKLS